MCGIAGWVDYRLDLTRERATALAMTGTMALRGPDAEGLWLSPHAALGHRRLSVIDLSGGRQPMTAGPAGAETAVLSYSGEVYNFTELRTELTARGHRFGTRSDTEVVLRSYLEWGADFATRLDGIFALALWDPRTEELLLVRDRMGVKPLYYHPTPDGVLFGSEPKAILANPAARAAIGPDGLRDVLSVAKDPGRAVFRGMHEVRPGTLVRVRRSGLSTHRYWALEVREHTDSLPRTVERVRELLTDVVARQLVADVPVCTLLSGGLDSSTLTALAAGLGPIRSYSVNDPLDDRPGPVNDDRRHARLLAEHVGSLHHELPLHAPDLLDPELRAAVLRAYDLPIAKGDEHASLHLLFREIRRHSTVALSGECGDEVFGGYRWQRNPEAVFSGTFPWVHSGRHRYQGTELLLDQGLLKQLDLNGHEHDSHRTACEEIGAGKVLADPFEARMREVTYLALTRHAQVLFDRKDRMSMAAGLEVRVPFAAHELVEYTFNVPWAMKSHDGREKSLLRAAARDLLPPEVADRVKTPYPSVRDTGYDRVLRERLTAVLRDGNAPLGALLAEDLLRTGTLPEEGLSRACLETFLQLNDWLTAYRVRIEL